MAQTRKSNGVSNQAQHPTGLMWRKNTPDSGQCDWSTIDPTILRGTIDAVTKAGGAVMFGVTADGGAFSLCILQGDQKIKEYPHGTSECEETLQNITSWFVDFKL